MYKLVAKCDKDGYERMSGNSGRNEYRIANLQSSDCGSWSSVVVRRRLLYRNFSADVFTDSFHGRLTAKDYRRRFQGVDGGRLNGVKFDEQYLL